MSFLYQQPLGIDEDEAMNMPIKDAEGTNEVKKVLDSLLEFPCSLL